MRMEYSVGDYPTYNVTVDPHELKIGGHFLDKEKYIGYVWYNDWPGKSCISSSCWKPQVFQGADVVPEGYVGAVLHVLNKVIEFITPLCDMTSITRLEDYEVKLTCTTSNGVDNCVLTPV